MSWWMLAGAALMAPAGAVDGSLGWHGLSGAVVFWSLSLGALWGILLGLVAGGTSRLLHYRHRLLQAGVWLAAGLACAIGLIGELNVLDRLEGEYQNFALVALVGSLVLGMVTAGVPWLYQTSPTHPRGRIHRWPRVQWALVGALVLGAGFATWADRNLQKGGYPAAHAALQFAAAYAALFALFGAVSAAFKTSARTHRVVYALVFVCVLLTGITLREHHRKALHAMLSRPYSGLPLSTFRMAGDFDGDGSSGILGGGDCDNFNSRVHPGATEIPDNGLDDNCALGDAKRNLQSETDVVWPDTESPTSVILITVDTVAAPNMSLYGAKRRTTPQLEKWAKGAAVFERAYTPGAWTSLALSSLFRGVYPRQLEWTALYETNKYRLLRRSEFSSVQKGEHIKMKFGLPLEDPRAPLAVWLNKRGMRNLAIINDAQAEFLDPKFMSDGFHRYQDLDDLSKDGGPYASDGQVTRMAIRTLKKAPQRPFFMWVHYFGPHQGSSTHKSVPYFGKRPVDRYDHELAYMDQQVAGLLEYIDRMTETRKLTVIVTSDHGEVVSETDRGHGRYLYEEGIHIPLLIKGEKFEAGRYKPLVSLIDLYPTIISLTESPRPPWLEGVDLTRVVKGDPQVSSRVLMSETWRLSKSGRIVTNLVAAYDGEMKLSLDLNSQAPSLRHQSPYENPNENLIGESGDDAEHLWKALQLHLEQGGSAQFSD